MFVESFNKRLVLMHMLHTSNNEKTDRVIDSTSKLAKSHQICCMAIPFSSSNPSNGKTDQFDLSLITLWGSHAKDQCSIGAFDTAHCEGGVRTGRV